VSALAALIETIRSKEAPPRVIFPSSIAVFGGLLPDTVDDDYTRRPQTTYGTHKAIAELMLADATRHGIIDSRTLRLPVVLVHPGSSSSSISDRIAAMVREATAGRDVVCPLRNDTRVPVASVQTVVRNLINLHNLEKARLRGKRGFNQPALTVSMDDIAASVSRVRNGKPPGKITFAPDPELKQIVDGWPKGLISTRAASIGTTSDRTFDDIIAAYLKGLQDRPLVSEPQKS
jgi:nucleoside-diphosphate-sugar epimerase